MTNLILTIIGLFLRLMDIYGYVLVAYALMSWIPSLYNTWVGRMIIKISKPYLDLFSKIPLRFGMFDFTVVAAIASLWLIRQFIFIILQSVLF
jgi:YggT family protein